MQRMQCTYTELQAQPAEVIDVVREFIIGEEKAREALKSAEESMAPQAKRGR
jgi:hypothetical protein